MRKIALMLAVFFMGITCAAAPTITVTSPTLNVDWCRGKQYAITWTSSGAVGAKVAIRLRQGSTPITIADTDNDGSYLWTVPASLATGACTILIRNADRSASGTSPSFNIADCIGAPPPAPVIKKFPPLERPPVILFPPQPRITQFVMDKATTIFVLRAENSGGAMKQDAQVVLTIPGGAGDRQISQTWSKGKATFYWADRLFANDGDPALASCTKMGGGDFCLQAEIRSPEVVGYPYPGLRDQECFPCYPDLAVVGFQWRTSGVLSFSVGNIGYCPSFAWSYRLYKDGQLVETSVRYGSMAPGVWSKLTTNYIMPAASSGSSTFRVEVVPENPAWEKNKGNNTLEVTTAPSSLQYQIAIADIQFYGDTMYGIQAPVGDEHYRLVFTLRNTSNKAWPQCPAQCRIFIDNGKVYEGSFPVAFDPYEEFLIIHDKGFPNFPILPYGIHTVEVWVSICPSSLTKKMMRPPQG